EAYDSNLRFKARDFLRSEDPSFRHRYRGESPTSAEIDLPLEASLRKMGRCLLQAAQTRKMPGVVAQIAEYITWELPETLAPFELSRAMAREILQKYEKTAPNPDSELVKALREALSKEPSAS